MFTLALGGQGIVAIKLASGVRRVEITVGALVGLVLKNLSSKELREALPCVPTQFEELEP